MLRGHLSRLALVLALIICTLPVLTFSQDKTIEQKIKVVQRITDLVVRDKDGNFVKDIKASDLVLTVNGDPAEVKGLERYEAVNPLGDSISQFRVEYRNAIERGVEPPKPPVPARNVILFFDCFYSTPLNIKEAKKSAVRMLDEVLLPHDKVTIFVYNNLLEHKVGPTTDRNEMIKAIESVPEMSKNSIYLPSWEEVVPPVYMQDVINFNALNMQKRTNYQSYLSALITVAKAYSAFPGRKSYLVFSEGPNLYNALALNPSLRAQMQMMSQWNAQNSVIAEDSEFSFNAFSPGNAYTDSGVNNQMIPEVINALNDASTYFNDSSSTFYYIRRGAIEPQWMDSLAQMVRTREDGKIRMLNNVAPTWAMDRTREMHNVRLEGMRDISRITGGKFYDAGVTSKTLSQNLIDQLGNYYEVAFSTAGLQEGKYYNLEIKIKEHPDYRVSYRKGFYGHKTFTELEGFDPSIAAVGEYSKGVTKNDLDMRARFYQLPMAGGSGALYFAEIDSSKLKPTEDGNYKIDNVVAVEDTLGRLRFHKHEQFVQAANAEVPQKLYVSGVIPLSEGRANVSLMMMDPASGKLSNVRNSMQTGVAKDSMTLTEPIFILGNDPGALKNWQLATIDDKITVHNPMNFAGFRLPGKPNYKNEFAQGSEATLFMLVGNLPEGFDVNTMELDVKYLVDSGAEQYRLIQSGQKAQYLRNSNSLAYMAKIPIGYIPEDEMLLNITFSGVGEQTLITSVNVKITDFSEEKAIDLLGTDLIIEFKE